jgi:hypothetical protein
MRIDVPRPSPVSVARQEKAKRPCWVDRCAAEIATALVHTAQYAVAEMAEMIIGVKHADVYATRVSQLQKALWECRLLIVNRTPTVKSAEDGVHWRVSSDELLRGMESKALHISQLEKKHEQSRSKRHKREALGVQASFEFPKRIRYCEEGIRFRQTSSSRVLDKQVSEKWRATVLELMRLMDSEALHTSQFEKKQELWRSKRHKREALGVQASFEFPKRMRH